VNYPVPIKGERTSKTLLAHLRKLFWLMQNEGSTAPLSHRTTTYGGAKGDGKSRANRKDQHRRRIFASHMGFYALRSWPAPKQPWADKGKSEKGERRKPIQIGRDKRGGNGGDRWVDMTTLSERSRKQGRRSTKREEEGNHARRAILLKDPKKREAENVA